MKPHTAIAFAALALCCGPCVAAERQNTAVIYAGQMFDGKSDRLLNDQVIIVQGGRIAEVGPAASVKVPAGAVEIDLRTATVLPGLIEGHNHMFKVGDHPGAGSDASVPAVIVPGTPFSAPYATILASINAKLDLEFGLYHRT